MPEYPATSDGVDVGAYCRDVEAHLCRRNGGHLIRLVGPAFTLVRGWATQGIPLRVVLHGVDQTITRLEARGPRRRPVRVEFCEADVLGAYDQWRRAIGPHASRVTTAGDASGDGEVPLRRSPSLARHMERVVERLSSVRAGCDLAAGQAAAVDAALAALDEVLTQARGARGDAKQQVRAALVQVDETLLAALVEAHADTDGALDARVRQELRPLRERLTQTAYEDAAARVRRHLLRLDLGIPEIALP